MRINEAADLVGCTRRAIKFYEEKGLLSPVSRQENGYRDYTPEDIEKLHEIQAYRKLGVSIDDIRRLLEKRDDALLQEILLQKKRDLQSRQEELDALTEFIKNRDAQQLDEQMDYETIAHAMRTQLPGLWGRYIASHFEPYLQIRITTGEQQEAYQRILAFWDNPKLKLPLLFKVDALIASLLPRMSDDGKAMDAIIQSMLNPDDETYARIRAQTLKSVRARENLLIRYSPPELLRRRMMRSLRDCGYYDLFIPEMRRLSPAYRAYHDAMDALNKRLCRDLSLYYDSDYNLRIKK